MIFIMTLLMVKYGKQNVESVNDRSIGLIIYRLIVSEEAHINFKNLFLFKTLRVNFNIY